MSTNTLIENYDRFVLGTYARDRIFVRGSGTRLWDADGGEFLDFTSGIGVCSLGHCHPQVSDAIARQAARLVHVSNLFYNELQGELAARIASHSFNGRVFFCNSGAEANEGLIKFARKWGSDTGRFEIICMAQSFHGRTLATLSATGQEKPRQGFAPDTPGFCHVPFNDLAALEAAVSATTAAVLMEPVQGEGGVMPAEPEFIAGARQLCDDQGILLLFDEVQCGMGRTGHWFAYQHYGVEPDAMAIAKALGNGFPIGAFTVQQKWEAVLGPGSHATTFGGTPLACAAAIAVCTAMAESELLDNCRRMGEHLRSELERLGQSHACVQSVRGLGLMLAMQLDTAAAPIVKQAAENGLLVLSAGENVLRFLPPLNVSETEIAEAVAILDSILASI